MDDKGCCGETGEFGGGDKVGAVILYPPFNDVDGDVEEAVDEFVEPIGFPGFIFATKPASPSMAKIDPYQNLLERTEDLATAISRECLLNLRIFHPSSRPFHTFWHDVLRHH